MTCVLVSRLMSGLQASISTHIAKFYYFPDGHWGSNIPLFIKAVGSHSDRLNNLYFAYLFLLRAVVKAGDALVEYPYSTGNHTDDVIVRRLMKELVTSRIPVPQDMLGYNEALVGLNTRSSSTSTAGKVDDETLEECRNGFDESLLFQVPSGVAATQYWENFEEKQLLMEEFRNR
jgi:hypothetical protein